MRIMCWYCHKSVSTELPDDALLGAIAVCPECIGKLSEAKEHPLQENKTVCTRIYASIDKDEAYSKGKEIGLSGTALNLFKHFNEVELEIEVQPNGIVSKVKRVML